MNWFTCGLEKYLDKKKYSRLMGTWLKEEDTYNFYYKQKMLPLELNPKQFKEHLKDKLQESTWRNDHSIIDRQQVKEFLIWDHGCQFIHFRIYDYRNYPVPAYRGNYCRLVLVSTDDNDWEVQFHSDLLREVMKYIQKNHKHLTLGMIEDEFKPEDKTECRWKTS